MILMILQETLVKWVVETSFLDIAFVSPTKEQSKQ